jgi:Ser/Thr protein kinase RdoA (MazF antagonist)
LVGDCHPGNMLWTDLGPHFVDLEDCRMGPAIPDPWMMLSGNRSERALQLATPREADATFHALDPRELAMIEPLCALGMIHLRRLALAPLRRPHVPLALPGFGTPQYWQDHVVRTLVRLTATVTGSVRPTATARPRIG